MCATQSHSDFNGFYLTLQLHQYSPLLCFGLTHTTSLITDKVLRWDNVTRQPQWKERLHRPLLRWCHFKHLAAWLVSSIRSGKEAPHSFSHKGLCGRRCSLGWWFRVEQNENIWRSLYTLRCANLGVSTDLSPCSLGPSRGAEGNVPPRFAGVDWCNVGSTREAATHTHTHRREKQMRMCVCH